MISLSNITKTFDTKKVLDEVTISLEKGQVHVLMGMNGAGKSSLARILSGLEGHFDGDIQGVDRKVKTMLMQQDFVVWPELSVASNMSLAGNKRSCSIWLEKAGLSQLARQKAGKLSHGQKQRLSIARALASEPKLLIVDEALSYLDPMQSGIVQEWVLSTLRDPSSPLEYVLWITQQATEAFAVADKLSILENGKLTCTGLPSDIYESPETVGAARLTGIINIFTPEEWDSLGEYLNASAAPCPKDRFICIRPEWLSPIPLSEGQGMDLESSRFTPAGHLSRLYAKGLNPVFALTNNSLMTTDSYYLQLQRAPLILPST